MERVAGSPLCLGGERERQSLRLRRRYNVPPTKNYDVSGSINSNVLSTHFIGCGPNGQLAGGAKPVPTGNHVSQAIAPAPAPSPSPKVNEKGIERAA